MAPSPWRSALVFLLALMLSSCGGFISPTPTERPPAPTETPLPPSPTPLPLAASVNGQPILLVDFEGEVRRYEDSQRQRGIELAPDGSYRLSVLEAIIDLELLAQAAEADGAGITDEALSERIDQLAEERGGSGAMAAWMAENHYDLESFRRALRREILAQHAVRALADGVPAEVEQVHVRHILVDSRQRAEELRSLLEAGAEFGPLAVEHSQDPSSRVNGGDLGWLPPGLLKQPALEEAAFRLAPGQLSEVIETQLGYHLVHVMERETRPLSPNDARTLRQQAVEAWLAEEQETAQIEILIEL